MSDPSPASSLQPGLPDSGLRTALSLGVFIHLFAITVALASYTAPSQLLIGLRRVMGPYIRTFNFDFSYRPYPTARLYLTHGESDDVDFRLEIDAQTVDGKQQTVRIPGQGLWPPVRRQRYQALANAIGSMIPAERREAAEPLLQSIAGSVLAQSASTRGSIRCISHTLLSREDAASSNARQRDPLAANRFEMPYDAAVVVTDGQVGLIPRESALESAPARKGR